MGVRGREGQAPWGGCVHGKQQRLACRALLPIWLPGCTPTHHRAPDRVQAGCGALTLLRGMLALWDLRGPPPPAMAPSQAL